ncbi:uncharacterized protein FIESC28_08792 [Fusarium coffeatum]|uniref:MARVEL domain-containing protein n=1 Tax=Fusarium coffeatum TaxID=231269 RepID=A0A366R426_9HYPO|nr:uncharacterized protein FIESC28_08792 [Fusarium coffeatum]RBR11907.1 hypothetical protein FIESC28_08792 [Fusarium coffeatum]
MAGDNPVTVNHPARVLFLYSAAIGLPLNLIRFIVMLRPTAIFTMLLLIASAVMAWIIRRKAAHIKLPPDTPITKPWNCLIADISLAILSFIILIFTWTHNREHDSGKIFLVSYSSTSLIFNMFLHLYLALLVLLSTHKVQDYVKGLVASTPQECPNCHNQSAGQDEEQALMASVIEDQEEPHSSGRKDPGSSSVWN